MAVGAVALAYGCAKLSPKTPKVSFVGSVSIREFEEELFLECVEPEAQEMVERKLRRSSMDRPLYYSDKANRDQPTTLHIPTSFTMTAQAFRSIEKQGRGRRPQLVIQLRERTKVLKAKVYQIQTPLYDPRDEFVRMKIDTEKFPRYYDWNWHPKCNVRGERAIRYRVHPVENLAGLGSQGVGRLDKDGMIRLDLQPFLDVGAASEQGLQFVFTCDHEGLHANVRIPQEVFQWRLDHE